MDNNRSHHKTALTFMVLGTVLVLGSLVVMNELSKFEGSKESRTQAQFQIEKIEKKKDLKKPKPKPKPKPKRDVAKKAPPPNLNTQLTGANFGLSMYEIDLSSLSDSVLGNTDNVIMTEDSVDELPKVTSRPPLDYPSEARAKGLRGFVTLNVLVNSKGEVEKVKVSESEPKGVFDQVALNSVENWNFTPATYQGRTVAVWVKQKIRFDFN